MAVASIGVRLSDDFEKLPLFETPPLDGPTNVRQSERERVCGCLSFPFEGVWWSGGGGGGDARRLLALAPFGQLQIYDIRT